MNTIAFLGKTPITDVAASAFNPANVDKTKIDLSVRKDSKAAFDSDPLWSQFRTRGVSFFKETNGTGNGTTEYFPLSKKRCNDCWYTSRRSYIRRKTNRNR